MKYISTVNNKEYTIEIIDKKHLSIDGVIHEIDFESISGQPVFSLIIDGKSHEAFVYFEENRWRVMLQGNLYPVLVEDEREKRLRAASGNTVSQTGEYHLKAPMPGIIISVPVESGQEIRAGDTLAILESMKMQNELKSPCDGIVTRIRVQSGDSVEKKQTLISINQKARKNE